MKKTTKNILILCLLVSLVSALALLSACGGQVDQETIKKQEGYSCVITYDANGGNYGGQGATKTYALVKENSLVPAPGYLDASTQASIKLPTRTNYELLGDAPKDNQQAIESKCWFVAKTDEEGNVLRDENGNAILLSETPWNFATDKATGNVTLVAMWQEVYKFIVCIESEDEKGNATEIVLRSFKVKPGATIAEKLYNKEQGEFVDRPDYIKISDKDYTLLDFYMDKEFTQDLDFDLTHPGQREICETVTDPETGETTNQTVITNDVKIYAKYLNGRFDFITQKTVDEKSLNLSQTSKWYLLESVDLTYVNAITQATEQTEWQALSQFDGEIYGNGYKISGFYVNSQALKPEGEYKAHSIFGKVNGVIDNLTLSGKLTVTASEFVDRIIGEQRVAFIAYSIGESGKVTQLTIDNCSIEFVNASKFQASINQQAGALFYEINSENQPTYIIKDENGGNIEYIEPTAN